MHVSHEALPDWRVEKCAISGARNGHDVRFAGVKSNNNYKRIFSEIYDLSWSAKARFGIPFYSRCLEKQLNRIIGKAKPDIVHAHNIFSAKLVSKLDIPLVYDDHEYWPLQAKLLKEISTERTHDDSKPTRQFIKAYERIKRKLQNDYAVRLWTRWEEEVVSSHPTITVSYKIAEEMQALVGNTGKIFIVPNYPLLSEVRTVHMPTPQKGLSSVYAGGDANNIEKYPHLNRDGLPEVFCNNDVGNLTLIGSNGPTSPRVRYTGYLTRETMYDEMAKHSVGLIPFKKHWSHPYLNPNKAYEYAQVGLYVLCTSSLTSVQRTLKHNCSTFEDFESLVSQLEYFKNNPEDLYTKRVKMFEYAHDKLIWERNEQEIARAYQKC